MRSKRAHDLDLSKHGFPDVVVSSLDYFCSVYVSFCLVTTLLNSAIGAPEKRTKKEICQCMNCSNVVEGRWILLADEMGTTVYLA